MGEDVSLVGVDLSEDFLVIPTLALTMAVGNRGEKVTNTLYLNFLKEVWAK